jgi:hypothetical protein
MGWNRSPTNTAQIPFPPTTTPHQNFLDFSNLWKILKTFQIIENTRNIASIVLIFRTCGVKVSKIQVEREGVLGGWWVMPSTRVTAS